MAKQRRAKRKMTEAQLWAWMARGFARIDKAGKRRSPLWLGMCHAMGAALDDKKIYGRTWQRADNRMKANKPYDLFGPYWWSFTKSGYRERAAFCRRMAKLAARRRR